MDPLYTVLCAFPHQAVEPTGVRCRHHGVSSWRMDQANPPLSDRCLRWLLLDFRYLILDRDTIYTEAFRDLFKRAGIKVVRQLPRSPNLNAYPEKFVRTIKGSCLDRMIFFGTRSLRNAIRKSPYATEIGIMSALNKGCRMIRNNDLAHARFAGTITALAGSILDGLKSPVDRTYADTE